MESVHGHSLLLSEMVGCKWTACPFLSNCLPIWSARTDVRPYLHLSVFFRIRCRRVTVDTCPLISAALENNGWSDWVRLKNRWTWTILWCERGLKPGHCSSDRLALSHQNENFLYCLDVVMAVGVSQPLLLSERTIPFLSSQMILPPPPHKGITIFSFHHR